MMLTRFVRIQLALFATASIVGALLMIFNYIQLPTLLGIGRISVTLELPAAGGLYRFSNVTYRGVQVGKVTKIALNRTGAKATLSLDISPRIPADLRAEVRSVSAVGEQYVDLRPRTNSGPYLHDGSVISAADTTIPQAVGPMLDKVSALVGTIPNDRLSVLLDEMYKGLDGAGYELRSLFDSSTSISSRVDSVADRARGLIDDSAPLLDAQNNSADALRIWARSLAGITATVANDDNQVRTLLRTGPPAASELTRLLAQIKPTLPVLLANLTSLGQVLVTYNPSLEQLLVLLPPSVASIQAVGPMNNPAGIAMGDFSITLSDPPACTVGFLPPSQWRSPADTTTIDTPDGLYCKLPQDSPLAVRGARNYPCMAHPGKRAPTVEICDSDQSYSPLAMRQHALGPSPLDPNLVSQGIPPDTRTAPDAHTIGPVAGTPGPDSAPSGPAEAPPPTVGDQTPSDQQPTTPTAAPSAFSDRDTRRPELSMAVAEYNPATGTYVGSDRHTYRVPDLVAPTTNRSWMDMMPT